MHKGWRELLKQKFKKPSAFLSLGLRMGASNLELSVLKKVSGHPKWMLQHTLPRFEWQKELKRYIQQNGLGNCPCHVSLSSNQYQLLQIDKPAVGADEITQALKWQVKDLLLSQDDVVLEYFDIPAQMAGAEKINVVAVERAPLLALIQELDDAGLAVASVTIEELALCELPIKAEGAVMTLYQRGGGEMIMSIVKNGVLYFSRRLKGYENLSQLSEEELAMGSIDALSIELQRSLDYFESQLRQAPVKDILLILPEGNVTQIAAMLNNNISANVALYELELPCSPETQFASRDSISLGAALIQLQQVA